MKKISRLLLCLTLIATMCLISACGGVNGKTKYTVTFDANGGAGAPAAYTNIESGKTIDPPTSTGMVLEGKTFTGKWYKEAACTTEWDFDTDKVVANITLYAEWSINKYTVTFDANGGKNAPAALENVAWGRKISEPVQNPSKKYGTFEGWYKEAACTTLWNFYTNTVKENVTLFAKWSFNKDAYININLQLISAYGDYISDMGYYSEVAAIAADYNDGDIYEYAHNLSSKTEIDQEITTVINRLQEIDTTAGEPFDTYAVFEQRYLSEQKTSQKGGLQNERSWYISEYNIDNTSPVYTALNDALAAAEAAIDAAEDLYDIYEAQIDGRNAMEKAILPAYKAILVIEINEFVEGLTGYDAAQTAAIEAKKTNLLERMESADVDNIQYITNALSNFKWFFDSNNEAIFFALDAKYNELMLWVNEVLASNDLSENALIVIEHIIYNNFYDYGYSDSDEVDSGFLYAILYIVQEVKFDGGTASHPELELVEAKGNAEDRLWRFVNYIEDENYDQLKDAWSIYSDYYVQIHAATTVEAVDTLLDAAIAAIVAETEVDYLDFLKEEFIYDLEMPVFLCLIGAGLTDFDGNPVVEDMESDPIYLAIMQDFAEKTDLLIDATTIQELEEAYKNAVNTMCEPYFAGFKVVLAEINDAEDLGLSESILNMLLNAATPYEFMELMKSIY